MPPKLKNTRTYCIHILPRNSVRAEFGLGLGRIRMMPVVHALGELRHLRRAGVPQVRPLLDDKQLHERKSSQSWENKDTVG